MFSARELFLALANILVCSGQLTSLNDVGIFNGHLVGLGDYPETHLDRISTGFGLERLALRQRLGQNFGQGVGIGSNIDASLRPGTVPIAGLGLALRECQQSCLIQSSWHVTARCRYTPIQHSQITGRYCLGCPVDLCDGGGGLPITGLTGGAGTRAMWRRERRRQRRQRRRMCRQFGICLGDELGGAQSGIGASIMGTGVGMVSTGYEGRIGSGRVW